VSDRRVARPTVRITLLGRITVRTRAGYEIRLMGRHAQALTALLALTQRRRTRESIAADLWPETPIAATGPLRQALYQVRTALLAAGIDPEAVLESDAETLGLRPEAVHSLDVSAFEACTNDRHRDQELAIGLYGGDLAEGLAHDCFAAERERLADRYEDALADVAASRLEAGDLAGARGAAERLLSRDPLREEAHAALIAIYGRAGTRSQVVRQYRRLCVVLGRELGEAPLPETEVVYRAALRATVERSRRAAATHAEAGTDGPRLVAISR
jgi:DNA-binding SARP family transcriptional activator